MNKTIVLTGGGTAGHVCPNINLSTELKKYFDKIVYIGTSNGIENKLIKTQTDYEYYSISAVKFTRKNLLKNISLPFKLSKSISEAKKILKKVNPSIIFSKGGYVSLPVVIASHKLKIPVISHESDISMGLANKVASKYSNLVCTNFEVTAKNNKKCIYTGSPLPISQLTKQEARIKLGIETTKPILLVTGGSQGAKAINDVIYKSLDQLTKNYYIIHLVGKGNYNKKIKSKDYKQIEFSNDIWTIFKASDFAISRAGANTISELLANKIPTIFIPLPKGISRGDQVDNSKYLEKLGVAKVIYQNELTPEKLQNTLKNLEIQSKNIISAIKKQNFTDGTYKIINLILKHKKDD